MYASLVRAIGSTQNPRFKRRADQWPQSNPGVPLPFGDELMSDLASADTAVNYVSIPSMSLGNQAAPQPWTQIDMTALVQPGLGGATFGNMQLAGTLANTGLFGCCNGITAGSGFTQRDGGRIQMRLLTGQIQFAYNPVASYSGASGATSTVQTFAQSLGSQRVRLIILIDRQPNGIQMTEADLFETEAISGSVSFVSAPFNWNKRHRIVPLMDTVTSLAYGEGKCLDLEIPIPEAVAFTDYTDSNGTVSSISTNALYVYIVGESSFGGGVVYPAPFVTDMSLRLLYLV